MKIFSILLILLPLMQCDSIVPLPKDPSCEEGPKYLGKLAVQGICMNYVITVEGEVPEEWYEKGFVAKNWVDPYEEVTYSNAFRLGSICDFPDKIKEGDQFYFTLIKEEQICAQCLAYSPTPTETLSIKVCTN
jgi:hypothetical protein